MDPNLMQNIPQGTLIVIGLIQFGIVVWLFAFPVLILRKLSEIVDILKEREK